MRPHLLTLTYGFPPSDDVTTLDVTTVEEATVIAVEAWKEKNDPECILSYRIGEMKGIPRRCALVEGHVMEGRFHVVYIDPGEVEFYAALASIINKDNEDQSKEDQAQE